MATITTLDQIIAGVQPMQYFGKPQSATSNNVPFSFWGIGPGNPGAGTFNTTLAGGTYSSTGGIVAGQIPHTDPAAGINSYVNHFSAVLPAFGNPGFLLLCDRLWDNGGINVNSASAQTINSPTWPARDSAGLSTGTGILVGLEVSATTASTGTPTVGISYTNSFGTAGRSAGGTDTLIAASSPGFFYRLGWHSGDAGVQSIQSLTFGGTLWTSGTVNLVAYRVITSIACPVTGASFTQDCVTGGLPRVFNGSVPFVMYFGGAVTVGLSGIYQEVQI